MAVPKQRNSRARKRKRQTHLRLAVPLLSSCPQCARLRAPHRVCIFCRTYKGRKYEEEKRVGR